ncbi:hypothetical protein LAC79_36400 (plasmid) [Ensifer adhaerens]|nr:hypothetical protein [Ensifer adhaerens]MBZ7927234.1 hypothetical protein [Ensifer adhaerens]
MERSAPWPREVSRFARNSREAVVLDAGSRRSLLTTLVNRNFRQGRRLFRMIELDGRAAVAFV